MVFPKEELIHGEQRDIISQFKTLAWRNKSSHIEFRQVREVIDKEEQLGNLPPIIIVPGEVGREN